jgi:hypothetical protein
MKASTKRIITSTAFTLGGLAVGKLFGWNATVSTIVGSAFGQIASSEIVEEKKSKKKKKKAKSHD